jgi:hypothetical protein
MDAASALPRHTFPFQRARCRTWKSLRVEVNLHAVLGISSLLQNELQLPRYRVSSEVRGESVGSSCNRPGKCTTGYKKKREHTKGATEKGERERIGEGCNCNRGSMESCSAVPKIWPPTRLRASAEPTDRGPGGGWGCQSSAARTHHEIAETTARSRSIRDTSNAGD